MPYVYIDTKSKKPKKKNKKGKNTTNAARKKAVELLLRVVQLTEGNVRIRAFAKTLAGDVHKLKSQRDLEENVYKARHLCDLVLDMVEETDTDSMNDNDLISLAKLAEFTHDATKHVYEIVHKSVGPEKTNKKLGSGWYKSEYVKKQKGGKMHNPWIWRQVHAPKSKSEAPWMKKKQATATKKRVAAQKTPWFMKRDSDVFMVSDSKASEKTRKKLEKPAAMQIVTDSSQKKTPWFMKRDSDVFMVSDSKGRTKTKKPTVGFHNDVVVIGTRAVKSKRRTRPEGHMNDDDVVVVHDSADSRPKSGYFANLSGGQRLGGHIKTPVGRWRN